MGFKDLKWKPKLDLWASFVSQFMEVFLKKYSWVAYLVLLFVGAFFLAKMTSGFIASKLRIEKRLNVPRVAVGEVGQSKRVSFEDYRIILDRNIFDSREIAKEESAKVEATPQPVNLEGPAVKTSLPIKLISTVSVGDGTDKRSSAAISSGRGQEETYAIGDEKQFSPGVELKKVLPDRIEFVNNRRLEYAEIEDFGGGVTTGKSLSQIEREAEGARSPSPAAGANNGGVKEVDEGKFVVERAEIENALSSLDKLFTQIRAVPQFKDGKAAGLKLLSIRQDSLFAKLGLRRNDVLERINGQPVDMKKGVELFGQLQGADRISIDLVRNGQNTTLEYEIQ